MGEAFEVRFFDNLTNERIVPEGREHQNLIRLRNALCALAGKWKTEYPNCPKITRVLIFCGMPRIMTSYTTEFEGFPSIAYEIGNNVLWSSTNDSLVSTLGAQISAKVQEVRNTTYWKNTFRKEWWETDINQI